jgi:hypothetical protein
VVVMVSAILLASGPSAGQDKKDDKEKLHPYSTTKVGDFAIYKAAGEIEGKGWESTRKETVTAKDEKSVKLKVINLSTGKESEKTIDLTEPYEYPTLRFFKAGGTFKKTGEGTEKIKVAGKEYDANWIAGTVTTKVMGKEATSAEMKVWFSKDAPLDGFLRMKMAKSSEELIEFGAVK